jgi:prepilin-type N-terminal cleavage/methylation domain-containing protein
MRRRGFTVLELVVVIGLIGVIAAFSVPMFRRYQMRSDLSRSADQVTQALGRARALAQAGTGDAPWGFSVTNAVLFKGKTFAARDPAFDEEYPIPSTIVRTGLAEASFSKLEGKPSQTGSIVLTALSGEQAEITILLPAEGVPVVPLDRLTICHCESGTGHTLSIPDNAWPGHLKHGDALSACEGRPNPCKGK